MVAVGLPSTGKYEENARTVGDFSVGPSRFRQSMSRYLVPEQPCDFHVADGPLKATCLFHTSQKPTYGPRGERIEASMSVIGMLRQLTLHGAVNFHDLIDLPRCNATFGSEMGQTTFHYRIVDVPIPDDQPNRPCV